MSESLRTALILMDAHMSESLKQEISLTLYDRVSLVDFEAIFSNLSESPYILHHAFQLFYLFLESFWRMVKSPFRILYTVQNIMESAKIIIPKAVTMTTSK